MVISSTVCAVVYSLSIGGIQTLTKAAVGYICPSCFEASVYSLLELTNKGSSWLTPIFLLFLESMVARFNDKSIISFGSVWYILLYLIA